MMNESQANWTLFIVILIGALFGLYTALMIGYFMDALPSDVPPLFLIARVTPCYLGGIAFLEFCWFLRWNSLATL
jgi:hypothetical protein